MAKSWFGENVHCLLLYRDCDKYSRSQRFVQKVEFAILLNPANEGSFEGLIGVEPLMYSFKISMNGEDLLSKM